jgi:hypothetical protein
LCLGERDSWLKAKSLGDGAWVEAVADQRNAA